MQYYGRAQYGRPLTFALYDIAVCRARRRLGVCHRQMLQASPGRVLELPHVTEICSSMASKATAEQIAIGGRRLRPRADDAGGEQDHCGRSHKSGPFHALEAGPKTSAGLRRPDSFLAIAPQRRLDQVRAARPCARACAAKLRYVL
jgi:hypothetical protein